MKTTKGKMAPEKSPVSHYICRLPIRASSERVYKAIATRSGLSGWWTTLVSGSPNLGGQWKFEFVGLDEHVLMQVDTAIRPSLVKWTCLEHADLAEWKGTQLIFEIQERSPRECELLFQHVGLVPQLKCYFDCESGWDHFLTSLVAFAEDGKGTPFGGETLKRM